MIQKKLPMGRTRFICKECGHNYIISMNVIEKDNFQFIKYQIMDIEELERRLNMTPGERIKELKDVSLEAEE